MLKAFTASYSETWAYGGYANTECVVVANTESEALGFLLEEYKEHDAKYWLIQEIDLSKPVILQLSDRSS
jgi:hypothetical protein